MIISALIYSSSVRHQFFDLDPSADDTLNSFTVAELLCCSQTANSCCAAAKLQTSVLNTHSN